MRVIMDLVIREISSFSMTASSGDIVVGIETCTGVHTYMHACIQACTHAHTNPFSPHTHFTYLKYIHIYLSCDQMKLKQAAPVHVNYD